MTSAINARTTAAATLAFAFRRRQNRELKSALETSQAAFEDFFEEADDMRCVTRSA